MSIVKIKRFIGGTLESNGYVIYQKEQGGCYIIDPGYNPGIFAEFIEGQALKPLGILLTHHHYDHTGSVKKLCSLFDCPAYIHREDLDIYGQQAQPLEDGDVFMLEEEEIKTVHTPGHTAGSVCFYSDKSKLAFTGDTIFNVDLGRTDLEDGSEADMIHSCRDIIDKWSNEIFIHPGHGDGCTMKKVRVINREFLDIING